MTLEQEQAMHDRAEEDAVVIKTVRGLAVQVVGEAARDNNSNEKRIARRLYKDTECGISFWIAAGGVGVQGYAEGTDADCEPYFLRFPFTVGEFWRTVEDADRDGCALFDETHCPVCGAENLDPLEADHDCSEEATFLCAECGEEVEEEDAVWVDPETRRATTGTTGRPFHVGCAPDEFDCPICNSRHDEHTACPDEKGGSE